MSYKKRGDRGQAPLQDNNGTSFSGVVGSGVKLPKTTIGRLSYRLRETNGRLNVRLDQGGIRFWFKPDWTFTTQNLNYTDTSGNTAL